MVAMRWAAEDELDFAYGRHETGSEMLAGNPIYAAHVFEDMEYRGGQVKQVYDIAEDKWNSLNGVEKELVRDAWGGVCQAEGAAEVLRERAGQLLAQATEGIEVILHALR